MPIDPGQTKNVKLKVTPPNTAAAGSYKVEARVGAEDASATADLTMDITGQPRLDISGREGLVSTQATAGKETSVPVVITNNGTAPAENVELSGSAPSGWKVTFDPKTVDHIAPNANKEVQALITPTDKAIAGDYVTTIRASARGEFGIHEFPRHGDDFDPMGHRRRRHHRRRAAGDGRCGRKVRPPMSEQTVIEAKDLTKTYGSAVAVDHISFTVGRGEIFGLLGPNGAGKTTTILMLLGLTDISAGEVRVVGFNPAREPLSVKRRVGYLPDTVGFYDHMSAADNLRYTARLIGFKQPSARRGLRMRSPGRAGRAG